MKISIISFLSFIFLISCESKAQNNKNNFCINTNKIKSPKECEECILILDEMLNKNEITKQDYIVKKINYFLLLKKYDEAITFIEKENFKYSQEKEIRKEEIIMVKSYCADDITKFNSRKFELLKFINAEMIKNPDKNLLDVLKNEKSFIESNLIVDYYCKKEEKKDGVSVIQ